MAVSDPKKYRTDGSSSGLDALKMICLLLESTAMSRSPSHSSARHSVAFTLLIATADLWS